jgi:molybdopterin-guanine dinucleotide biosynthesis protein A
VIAGLVLAGGKSTRFGSDKALATFAGKTLIEHAQRKLDAIASITALNAPPFGPIAAFARDHAWLLVSDAPYDPPSPLAGVRAGLAWAHAINATHLAIAPCDTPLSPDDLHSRLAMRPDAPVVCARTPERMHPLASLWRTDMAPLVAATLLEGKHRPIRDLMIDWGAAFVDFADDAPFANVNTPDDLSALSPV